MAQAFNIAYEKWQATKKKKEGKKGSQQNQSTTPVNKDEPHPVENVSLGMCLGM